MRHLHENQATPRPWYKSEYGVEYRHPSGLKFHICVMGSGDSTTVNKTESEANAELIVTAVNERDALNVEVERLTKSLNELQVDIESLQKKYNGLVIFINERHGSESTEHHHNQSRPID